MNDIIKTTISIFVIFIVIVLLLGGYSIHNVNNSTNSQQTLVTRKEELTTINEKLDTLIKELNKTIENYNQTQTTLINKLSEYQSAEEIAKEKAQLAATNKDITLNTTIPDITKSTTPTQTVTIPAPVSKAS